MRNNLTALDVFSRYKQEDLPEFAGLDLKSPNQVGNFGNRPLHVACVRGDIEEVTALIAAGADVNSLGEMENTPLHEAIGQGHSSIVRILLHGGARKDVKNEFGNTPLDLAKTKGFLEILELLDDA